MSVKQNESRSVEQKRSCEICNKAGVIRLSKGWGFPDICWMCFRGWLTVEAKREEVEAKKEEVEAKKETT